MKNWTEFHVGMVYYSGLAVSALIGILSLWYLKPIGLVKKITEKSSAFWSFNFITTILIAGLLGAMSVSFTDCHGDYDNLLNARSTTIYYGLLQISTACKAYAFVIGVWLLILVILQMTMVRRMTIGLIYKITCVVLLIVAVFWFYDFRS